MFLKSNNPNLIPLLCGGFSTLLGTAVLFGWYTQNQVLIQVLPHFAPMQFNTALGFLLAGLGLISFAFKRSVLPIFLGSCCSLLGVLTLTQYIFGLNFGIDEMFMDFQVTVKTTQDGRMAPITALSFALIGLSLIIGRRSRRLQVPLAASIIALATLALVGYLTNVEGIYGWGNLTRMAIHTASCFLVLGIGALFLGLSGADRNDVDSWQLVPLTLSGTVLVLSVFSWYGIHEATQVRNAEHFDRLVSDTQDVLVKRYSLYEHTLLGGVGLFSASENVERLEWRAYVNALNIETTLPGIAGIGYIASVGTDQLTDFLKDVRSDDAPYFENHPATAFPDKFLITYIEPEEPNQKAVGLDIGFESNRREAAEYARDNGVHGLTKKIVLVQDGQNTPGFLLLLPVYETTSIPDTLETRREYFKGWVYAPFIASNFMDGLTRYNDDQVEFSVYDGEEASEEALIYSTGSNSLTSSAFERQTKLNLAGGQWTINWKATDKYRPAASRYMSTIVLIFGIFCAAILYLILLSLLRSKEIIAREVEKQTNKLAESERRLQLVFDSAGEGIFGLDLNGNITFANRAAQELLGYTLKEMVGRSQHSLIQHTCANGAPYDEQYSHTFSTINHGLTHNEDEEVFWHKNGTAISVEYTSEPIQDEDDAPIGAVVVFRDIAERKVAEAEIKQANAELEEFAYRTSHDLRSPLVSSITLLGITEKSIHTDDKSKALASLTHAQNSLRKLEELVKDILVLTQTKNESEGEQNIDLRELINGALDKFRYMDHFERLDIQIDLKFSEALIAKKNRVSLIVENLISNAVKYQDLTKDRSRLHLSTYKLDDKFVMVVQDNGIGIPKDQQDNLFKMFKRFHPKTAFGSGLGLYMVQKSIRILGGEIKYEDPGDGTIFKVYIPLA